jgi:C-terminal processing protease CtpA/Prc
MTTRTTYSLLAALITGLLTSTAAAAATDQDAAVRQKAEYQAMLEDAERARAEAEVARREAMRAAERAREAARLQAERAREEAGQARLDVEEIERQRAVQREEMERVQEELSRAHRELREATREIARAHREVARSAGGQVIVHEFNLGDRAVIGVVPGQETPAGVEIIAVSPDGPAERAGLQAGDVVVSIRGEDLGAAQGKAGRETLFRVIEEAEPGEALAVVVTRDGETWKFDVIPAQREPASWQSLIQIPAAPLVAAAPAAPGAPVIVEHVERIEIPRIDEGALNEQIQRMTKEMQTRKFLFVAPDGEKIEFDEEFEFPESFDVEIAGYSELAELAMREANMWFGLPHTQGLELARVNAGLGAYFKTERGVLVLEARADNAYRLESGDVVLDINTTPVNSPADLMRALREIEPGSEMELAIKRNRKDKTLTVTMPENRLGYSWSMGAAPAENP